MRLESTSPEMTKRIAAALARSLRAGDLVALSGPLGAGKTCFAQGLAEGLGIRAAVSSPSFVLAKHYPGEPGLLHIDAYRLSWGADLRELGLDEQMESGVTVVEWAENVASALPEDRIGLLILYAGEEARVLDFAGSSARWAQMLGELRREFGPEHEAGPEP